MINHLKRFMKDSKKRARMAVSCFLGSILVNITPLSMSKNKHDHLYC